MMIKRSDFTDDHRKIIAAAQAEFDFKPVDDKGTAFIVTDEALVALALTIAHQTIQQLLVKIPAGGNA